MGPEDPVAEVEDRVVGVRFRLVESSRQKKTGRVVLRCQVDDVTLFDTAVAKLDGLKLYSDDLTAEVMDALGDELRSKHKTLEEKDEHIAELEKELEARDVQLAELQALIHAVGMDLGLE